MPHYQRHSLASLFLLPLALMLVLPMACDAIGDAIGDVHLPGQKPPGEEVLPLKINTLSAKYVDRFGESLRIEITGQDGTAQVVGAEITLRDAQANELDYFDSDWDGRPDSGVGLLGFTASVQGQKQFNALIEIPKILRDLPELAQVQIRLLQADQHLSEAMSADIQHQAVLSDGESCDFNLIDNRCEVGLGCREASGVCEAGQPPQITDFAYLDAPESARILIAGIDPDADIKLIELSFFDADGQALAIDLDNDGIAQESVFDVELDGNSDDGRFLLRMEPTEQFTGLVRSLKAKALDWSAQWSDEVEADFVPPVYRSGSANCDPRGFDQCVSGTVCYPGDPEVAENKCMIIQSLRQDVCDQASAFDLDLSANQSGHYKIRGVTQGVSLWEPPADCSIALSTQGRPESVFALHVPEDLSQLDLSTVSDNTSFNTVLYLMPGCFSGVEQTLACNDDAPDSYASTIDMQNLPAGDYFVVVDSRGQFGGAFELSINYE